MPIGQTAHFAARRANDRTLRRLSRSTARKLGRLGPNDLTTRPRQHRGSSNCRSNIPKHTSGATAQTTRPSHPRAKHPQQRTTHARTQRRTTAPAALERDGGSVGHNLDNAVGDVARIEAHAGDRIRTHGNGVVDHAFHRFTPTLFERGRVGSFSNRSGPLVAVE